MAERADCDAGRRMICEGRPGGLDWMTPCEAGAVRRLLLYVDPRPYWFCRPHFDFIIEETVASMAAEPTAVIPKPRRSGE